jgi:hypothetical protein
MITHECAGCGDPTDHTVFTSGERHSICAACEHDAMFQCGDCMEKFWLIDGIKMTSTEVVCASCAAWRPAQIAGRMRELRHDTRKDAFNEVRR